MLEILESRSVDACPSWGLDMVNNMSILGEQQGKQNVRMFASVLTRAYMCECVCLRVLHRVVEYAKQADQHRVRIVVMVHAVHPSIPVWLLLRGLVAPPSGNRRNFRDFDKSIDEL